MVSFNSKSLVYQVSNDSYMAIKIYLPDLTLAEIERLLASLIIYETEGHT